MLKGIWFEFSMKVRLPRGSLILGNSIIRQSSTDIIHLHFSHKQIVFEITNVSGTITKIATISAIHATIPTGNTIGKNLQNPKYSKYVIPMFRTPLMRKRAKPNQ
jgi:hypothetical protein